MLNKEGGYLGGQGLLLLFIASELIPWTACRRLSEWWANNCQAHVQVVHHDVYGVTPNDVS